MGTKTKVIEPILIVKDSNGTWVMMDDYYYSTPMDEIPQLIINFVDQIKSNMQVPNEYLSSKLENLARMYARPFNRG